MGAEKTAVLQIEGVLFIPGRMIWRGVERVEAMPLRLDVWAFGQGKSHAPKNADTAVKNLC